MKDTEHKIQVAFVRWLRREGIFHFAIPNGGARTAITGRRLKDEGVIPGVPDLFLPGLRLFIEMKAPNGRLSEAQRDVHVELILAGYAVAVCRSVEEAIKAVEFYRNSKEWQKQINPVEEKCWK